MAAYKKTIGIALAALLLAGSAYGALSFGDTEVSAEVSQEVHGTFAGLSGSSLKLDTGSGVTSYTMAANAWVYRNSQKAEAESLKPGDTLEVILNSKKQAAYIKAAGQAEAKTEPAAGQTAPAAPAGTADGGVTEAPAAEAPAPAAVPSQESAGPEVPKAAEAVSLAQTASGAAAGAAAGTAAASSTWEWEKLELELKGRELLLKVKHEPGSRDGSDILIETKDRAVVRLNGAEAEKLLSLMLQGLPSEHSAWEAALKQRLAGHFHLDASQLTEWDLEVDWKENGQGAAPVRPPQNPKAQGKHDNGIGQEKQKDKDKGKDEDKDKGKNKEKEKGKGKGEDERDDD
ncbi:MULTISPECIES: hypothetical protein [Paenibacillus]|uniref:hypothetical protein n=1 Tax=Paenibacillus TaxID=44249 RepID=UPI0022B90C6E|nr:hypothetical protein [Paenibacillus caseinilyticus]MCZ8522903.1 hypothetical protein [Paenibacillus caseinilyticus]